jgi:hypothetical protein
MGCAQQRLRPVVVPVRVELEEPLAHVLRTQRGPHVGRRRVQRLHAHAHAGEHARQLLHVGLRVAAAHAQRVQLHQLARVVLVDAVARVLRVVQVAQHGRVVQRGAEQVAEPAERVRAHGVLFVVAHHRADVVLAQVDVEVVHPEPRHLLLQLVGRVQRAQHEARLRLACEGVQLLLVRLARRLLLVFVGQRVGGLALRVELGHELVERRARDGHGVDLRLRRGGQRRGARVELVAHPQREAALRELRVAAGVGAPAHAVEPAQARGFVHRGGRQRHRHQRAPFSRHAAAGGEQGQHACAERQ